MAQRPPMLAEAFPEGLAPKVAYTGPKWVALSTIWAVRPSWFVRTHRRDGPIPKP